VRRRIVRLVRRRGIALDQGVDDAQRTDSLALAAPVLAQIQSASVLGRVIAAAAPKAR